MINLNIFYFCSILCNKYEFCSETNIIFKKIEDLEYINDKRNELWNKFYSTLYQDHDNDLFNLDSSEKVEKFCI